MSPAWSRSTRTIVAVGLVLFGVFVLYLSRPILPLVALAAVLSFLLLPVVNLLHHRYGVGRRAAVLLTYAAAIAALVLAVLFVLPALINAVEFVLTLDYGALSRELRGWLEGLQTARFPFEPLERAVNEAASAMLSALEGVTPEAASMDVGALLQQVGALLVGSFNLISGLVGTVFSRLLTGIFVILLSLYLSMDAHRIKGQVVNTVPVAYQADAGTLLDRILRVWQGFLRGQLTLMLVIGVVVWLGLSLLGLPYALVLGIVAGLLEVIPNLGPIVATVPAVLVALLEGSTVLGLSPPLFALVIVIFYIVVQQLENNLIVPRLLGDAVELPPAVVMAGVLLGAIVGGVLGALLAAPLIASVKEIVSYLYRKVIGAEPFPPEPKASPPGENESLGERARRWLDALRARLGTGGGTGESDAPPDG